MIRDGSRRAAVPWRTLTPEQEDAVREAVVAGAKPRALAGVYGVHVRTIYRTLARTHREVVVVRVGDYAARFEVNDEGPVQLTRWYAAP